MRVQVNNPVVVGPRNSNGELFVLADNGAGAGVRTARGGIVIRDLGPEPPGDYRSGDFNPERIQLDDVAGFATPSAHVGDGFTTPVDRRPRLRLRQLRGRGHHGAHARRQRSRRARSRRPRARMSSSVATFNVENLDAAEPQSKFDALAGQIVNNMRSPDIVSLEEIQDNNGPTNDSVVDATQTLTKLVNSITAVGGPTYRVPADRPGRRPGRRRARRQHSRRLHLPDRPRRRVRRSSRRRLDDADDDRQRADGPELSVEPGTRRSCEPGVEREPQAAGRRVHLPRRDATS